ncbi:MULTISPECIES: hypothetical protein [unclassified Mesorhizobium]|uniref:hypothetical protein n=1 Tax=unclassified Mesorhizobium TaxID=325217 RepID=UPI00142F1D86|nr:MULTISPECIES: hypothetical protein [unclassified Mesorhizobium]
MAGAPFALAEKHIGERPLTMLLAANDTAAKITKTQVVKDLAAALEKQHEFASRHRK